MNIIWQYLDKRSATVDAIKDYNGMLYIIEHTDEEIADIRDSMTNIGSPEFSDMPHGSSNPQSGEIKITAAIDEIDVLRERYRQAKEYMEWFKPAWDTLSADERYVLEKFYWNDEGDAIYDICEKYCFERSAAYKRKNRAIAKLSLLLFGK